MVFKQINWGNRNGTRDPPPSFMANAVKNFHIFFGNPSLTCTTWMLHRSPWRSLLLSKCSFTLFSLGTLHQLSLMLSDVIVENGPVFGKYEVWAVCSAETKQSIMIFICLLASTIASIAVYQRLPLPQLNKRGGTPLSGNQQRLIHSLRAICTSLSSLLQPVLSSDRWVVVRQQLDHALPRSAQAKCRARHSGKPPIVF